MIDDNDGTIDWTSQDTVDWEDMLPGQYQMYKTAIDFLETYAPSSIFIK